MKKRMACLVTISFCVICTTGYAAYSVAETGKWPDSWPKELEPLRKQSRTLVGPVIPQPHYEIPFTKREQFESAWLHLLKVKSKGAPVILIRAPDARLGMPLNAGVRVYAAVHRSDNRPEGPISGVNNPREKWMYTTFIELVVDGEIVDLNRIPLPPDTPIVDERFKDGDKKTLNRSGESSETEPRPPVPH